MPRGTKELLLSSWQSSLISQSRVDQEHGLRSTQPGRVQQRSCTPLSLACSPAVSHWAAFLRAIWLCQALCGPRTERRPEPALWTPKPTQPLLWCLSSATLSLDSRRWAAVPVQTLAQALSCRPTHPWPLHGRGTLSPQREGSQDGLHADPRAPGLAWVQVSQLHTTWGAIPAVGAAASVAALLPPTKPLLTSRPS